MSKIFTKSALSNIKSAGTLFPSSRFLSNKISSLLPYNAQCLIELGPGNGAVTKSLLNAVNETAQLSCYEINEDFIKLLKVNINDSRLKILQRSALEIPNDFEANSVDAIVSCLPLALFNDDMKAELMQSIRNALKPGGVFIQYQYSLKDRSFIKQYFGCNKLRFVLLNIPPAFIYHCTKRK